MRQRPDEDKHAVASATAFAVIGILILVWGILFFRSIQNQSSESSLELGPVSAEIFDAIGAPARSVPPADSSLPSMFVLPAATSSVDEGSAELTFDVVTSPAVDFDQLQSDEAAAMRALRGDSAPSASSSTSF